MRGEKEKKKDDRERERGRKRKRSIESRLQCINVDLFIIMI